MLDGFTVVENVWLNWWTALSFGALTNNQYVLIYALLGVVVSFLLGEYYLYGRVRVRFV